MNQIIVNTFSFSLHCFHINWLLTKQCDLNNFLRDLRCFDICINKLVDRLREEADFQFN